jgi:mycothiol synthase
MNTTKTLLDTNLKLRAVKWTDLHAVAKLIYEVCEADGDTTVARTPEELEHEWHTEGFNPETDAFLVETKDGRVIGYEDFYNIKDHAHLASDGYFHPDFKGMGIDRALMERAEERAREEIKLAAPDLRVFIRSTIDGKDEIAISLHKEMGYTPARYFWRMEIELIEMPTIPPFPDGIEVRPFDKEAHARLVWEADNEAFSEHWGSHNTTFDEWSFRKFDFPEFDPSLWLIAWDGDQIAGFSQNRYRMGIGWVGTLGVRKSWRKKGLGLTLLKYSFADFYKRGMKTIGLGVDASNSTGATRLYEKAGMRVASEFVTFEKELRPGRSLEE